MPGGGGVQQHAPTYTMQQRGAFLALLGVAGITLVAIDNVAHPLGVMIAGAILILWLLQGEYVSDFVTFTASTSMRELIRKAHG